MSKEGVGMGKNSCCGSMGLPTVDMPRVIGGNELL